MDFVRTPDERFEDLPDYPFSPTYLQIDGLRLHYLDEGPRDAAPVLLLHGEPSWSYLYRKMIPPLAAAGYRVLAPDLIGFGRSDKPLKRSAYSYQAHANWLLAWIEALDLRDITLFCQDWGSLLGLRLAGLYGDRFARICVGNGFLPTGQSLPLAFHVWKNFSQYSPWFPIGRIVASGCVRTLDAAVIKAYDAPFPSSRYKAGARQFPALVPVKPDDPAVPDNRQAWEALGRWDKPFLCLFGKNDPILGKADAALIAHVPGAKDQPHQRMWGGHFVQEDRGDELARLMIEWMA